MLFACFSIYVFQFFFNRNNIFKKKSTLHVKKGLEFKEENINNHDSAKQGDKK